MVASTKQFALDQNFPPLLDGVARLLPDVRIVPLPKIDRRLSTLDDRQLVIALYQLGWSGLITNNYKMLYQPSEMAAILRTKIVVFAVKGVGDDPVRATGSVLLDFAAALKRVTATRRIFLVRPRNPEPVDGWTFF